MKVALNLPCHGDAKMPFACSLALLAQRTAKERPDIELGLFTIASSRLPKARNELAKTSLEWGADWLFMIDSDHSFPDDSLLRLLAHGHGAIGANQPTRSNHPEPTARAPGGGFIYTTPEKVAARSVEQVGWLGCGMLLVSSAVLAKLERPLFAFEGDEVGEDHFFCRRLIVAGVPLYVDHALSAEVRHLHTVELHHGVIKQPGG